MKNIKERFQEFANNVAKICSHISVRDDENGPYIFALGCKDTHTLQMRKIGEQYVLELWYGRTAEVEKIISEPSFSGIEDAFLKAKEWLMRDMPDNLMN